MVGVEEHDDDLFVPPQQSNISRYLSSSSSSSSSSRREEWKEGKEKIVSPKEELTNCDPIMPTQYPARSKLYISSS
jgi:hypothetical protein